MTVPDDLKYIDSFQSIDEIGNTYEIDKYVRFEDWRSFGRMGSEPIGQILFCGGKEVFRERKGVYVISDGADGIRVISTDQKSP